ncbi:S-layer homology domain-containing protein [Peptococcus simiae]|uniref:S-layer homology domain-containing protein n=1 Tax=Peptococcus simiae TaxID=1643805 RepID=UPI003980DE17
MQGTASLAMTGGSFEGNRCQKYGGAIYSSSDCQVTLTGVSFKNNSAKEIGGAIFAYGPVTMEACTFEGNQARSGGALGGMAEKVEAKQSTFTGNQAKYGGALIKYGGELALDTCQFNANVSKQGASIYAQGGTAGTLQACNFDGNLAFEKGSGIYLKEGTFTIANSTFSNNGEMTEGDQTYTCQQGGAIYYDEGKVTLTETDFKDNVVAKSGGAIFSNGNEAETSIEGGSFIGNAAKGEESSSGAICIYNQPVSIKNVNFANNRADYGGAGCIGFTEALTLENSTFTKNAASRDAGALELSWAKGALSNTDFEDNFALSKGAGLFIDACDLTLTNTHFIGNGKEGNQIAQKGGAVYSTFLPKVMRLSLPPANEDSEDEDGEAFDYGAADFSNHLTFKQCSFKQNIAHEGGGLFLHDADATLVEAIIDDNMAMTSGGGIYLSEAKAAIQKSILTNNGQLKLADGVKRTAFGGAIFTDDFDYHNPASKEKYQNLKIDNKTIFKNNRAVFLWEPPENYADFAHLTFKSTSLTGQKNPHDKTQPILKNDALLNNYDVNYKHPDDNSYYLVNYRFLAKEEGQALPEAVSRLLPEPTEDMIGALIIPPVLDRTSVQTSDGTWTFTGWEPIKGTVQKDTGLTFTGTWTLKKDRRPGGGATVTTPPKLNTEDHHAYMVGYPDQTFGPNRSMSRAEVATMFTRLLKDRPDKTKTYPSDLTDIDTTAWYANPVGYAAREAIIKGYPDGTFRPDAPISRAEFAAIASRFAGLKDGPAPAFTDLSPDHWAYESIRLAAGHGWIAGYPDNTFRPDQPISRAEVITITNRVLNRQGDQDWLNRHQDAFTPFSDMTQEDWYYTTIMEAVLGHDYKRLEDGKGERWLKLNDKTFI